MASRKPALPRATDEQLQAYADTIVVPELPTLPIALAPPGHVPLAGNIAGNVFIDIETASEVDLPKCGADVYFNHPSTRVLCLEAITEADELISWSEGEPVPERLNAMVRLDWRFWAHNYRFEQMAFRTVLKRLGFMLPLHWGCTQARARYNGLPANLENAAKALGLPVQKDMQGHRLMLIMCRPCGTNPDGSSRWVHLEQPAKLPRLKDYCLQDAKVSRAVHRYTRPIPPELVPQWQAIGRMNDRGIMVDVPFATAAVALARNTKADIDRRMKELTRGLVDATTKVKQLKEWLALGGVAVPSLDKRDIAAVMKGETLPEPARDAINLRLEAAKSSVSKYNAMVLRHVNGRVHDCLVWHGAGTGRLTSQGLQAQNFARAIHPAYPLAIRDVQLYEREDIELIYGEPMALLSSLLRPSIIAAPGHLLVGGDLSQIEARITAALARDERVLDVFRQGLDLYTVTAMFMFGLRRMEDVSELQRQAAKVCDLALGFGGGKGALMSMARQYGLTLTEGNAEKLVDAWRREHERHKRMWYAFERAAIGAVQNKGQPWTVDCGLDIDMACDGAGHLYMRLPSGRYIVYRSARVEMRMTPWGEERLGVTACGVNSLTRRYERYDLTYLILVENAVQGTAADVMFSGLMECDRSGYRPILSVHDELINEVPDKLVEEAKVRLAWCMTAPLKWLPELPLGVKTWSGRRYCKK